MMSCSKSIAVDIGTSTIGMALVDETTGAILAQCGKNNSQKKHGADVAARIRYGSTKEGALAMKMLVQEDLIRGFFELTKEWQTIKTIVISANTTMEYLFLGRNTEKLGSYPFHMEESGWREYSFLEVFSLSGASYEEEIMEAMKQCQAKVILLPCISTFVGGDIVSGLYHLKFLEKKSVSLLLDLGTNGEMAIAGENGFYTTSVAAGPAFEASIHGAGRKGTALLEWIARARCRNQMNKEGTVARKYEVTGIPLGEGLILKQEIIRKIQLAKGALLAGIELLLKQYGVTAQEVTEVYIGGNFGFHLDMKSAILVGMLPANFQGKIKVVGNASLKGAIDCIFDGNAKEEMEHMIREIQSINLAETKEFQELFIRRMEFAPIRL